MQTQPFDTTVTSDVGDLWFGAVNSSATFDLLTIAPGKSAVIHVTVTPAPSASAGTVVSGTMYLDDATEPQFPVQQLTGSEIAAIPYSYTVGS